MTHLQALIIKGVSWLLDALFRDFERTHYRRSAPWGTTE